jgi:hypothetical protein
MVGDRAGDGAEYRVAGRVSRARRRDRDPGHAEHHSRGRSREGTFSFDTSAERSAITRRRVQRRVPCDRVASAARRRAGGAGRRAPAGHDGPRRGVAASPDTFEFALGDPPRTATSSRSTSASRQTTSRTRWRSRSGFRSMRARRPISSRLDDPQIANSWLEFSASLTFY